MKLSVLKRLRLGAVMMACALSVGHATAQGAVALQVSNDPGGDVVLRMRQLQQLRRDGRRVEIRSGYCNSACTMYLGLPSTCVSRRVSFGFHGPTSAIPGIGLPPDRFEYWSQVMASHYPAPIRSWFLREGRMRTQGVYRISGAELIRLGVPECV